MVYFTQVLEGLTPKRYAIMRKLTEVHEDRIIGAPIYSCSPEIRLFDEKVSTDGLVLVNVADLIHGCEHLIPYTGQDPDDYRKVNNLGFKHRVDKMELYWRSPWYKRCY